MPILEALDATRICARASVALADPAVWARPAPTIERTPTPTHNGSYSWWSLVGNPQALLVTGMIGAALAKNAVGQLLAAGGVQPVRG